MLIKLIYKEKPNNMGLFIGTIEKFNKNRGYITLETKEKIEIGDTISIGNNTGTYTISELMQNSKNIKEAQVGNKVTIGRMQGNINIGDKIYKMTSKTLQKEAKESYQKENRKVLLNCEITIRKNQPISIHVSSCSNIELYKDLSVTCN